MDLGAILVLVIAVAIISFLVAFIWYLNIGGVYEAIKDRRFIASEITVRRIRIGLTVIVPVVIYAVLIWFFLSRFGWHVALAVELALPIVLFVTALVWAAVVSGRYQVVRDRMQSRVIATRKRAITTVGEQQGSSPDF